MIDEPSVLPEQDFKDEEKEPEVTPSVPTEDDDNALLPEQIFKDEKDNKEDESEKLESTQKLPADQGEVLGAYVEAEQIQNESNLTKLPQTGVHNMYFFYMLVAGLLMMAIGGGVSITTRKNKED